jgi:hypothetical protein
MFIPTKRLFSLPTVRCYHRDNLPVDVFIVHYFPKKLSSLDIQEFVYWKTQDVVMKDTNLIFLQKLVKDPRSYRDLTHHHYYLYDSKIGNLLMVPVMLLLASISGVTTWYSICLWYFELLPFTILTVPVTSVLTGMLVSFAIDILVTRAIVSVYKYEFDHNVKNNLCLLEIELQNLHE